MSITEENIIMKKFTALAAGAVLAVSASLAHAQSTDYVLSTASTGGTYHPVGTAISTLTKVKLLPKEKFSLSAVNSAGSGANVQAMGAGTADFAILQGLGPVRLLCRNRYRARLRTADEYPLDHDALAECGTVRSGQ